MDHPRRDEFELRLIAETLEPDRSWAIPAAIDLWMENDGTFPRSAIEELEFEAWRVFVRQVWDAEGDGAHLWLRQVETIADGDLRGEARRSDRGAEIDVTREGLTRRTALHEVAHLQADVHGPTGHRWAWAARYFGLLERWTSPGRGR
jgi:hypothetical protein